MFNFLYTTFKLSVFIQIDIQSPAGNDILVRPTASYYCKGYQQYSNATYTIV